MGLISALTILNIFVHVIAAVSIPGHAQARRSAEATSNTTWLENYEYVIVGSGPGGGPLAARLAIAGYKVLLIDAGDDQGSSLQEQVPGLMLQSTEYGPMKWDYFVNHYNNLARQEKDSKMTYQTPSGGLYVGPLSGAPVGSQPLGILYPRSGTLGGCSAHNALITILPQDSDWTNIATLTGDSSWSADNMKQYFERLERNRYLPNSVVGHGFSGWLGTALTSLTLVVEDPKLTSLIVAAATAMGQSLLGIIVGTVAGLGQVLLRDINAPGQTGQEGLYQVPLAVNIDNSARNGPRDFILQTASATNSDGSRKYQLDIRLNTLVTNIRFSQTGTGEPQATGVDFLDGQSLYRADLRSQSASPTGSGSVNATREVIISAGTFNTPQLLKLSGIGPQAELESFGIPVLVNLPGVGTNLQDRYENTVIGQTPTNFVITSQCTFLRTLPDPCLEQWQLGLTPDLRGAYASNGIALAIIKKTSVADGNEPDVLISGAPASFTGYYPGYSDNAIKDAKHWSWIVLKAHSRNNAGSVTLRSTDPRDTPIINFNSFDTGVTANGAADKDLQAVYEGIQYARQAFADLIPIGGTFSEVWPGSNVSTEAEVKEYIQNESWGHHASCTCPIGADGDPMAVLDSRFRVRGTKGLRVVDTSVFPKIPGFYIALPIYMISEKAADVIIADAAAS